MIGQDQVASASFQAYSNRCSLWWLNLFWWLWLWRLWWWWWSRQGSACFDAELEHAGNLHAPAALAAIHFCRALQYSS